MSIEAMKQALEALEMLARYENPETKIQVRKPKDGGPIVTMYPHKVATDAADALRTAIEQAETQEQAPMAYLCENAVGHKYFRWKKPSSTYKPIALYTTSSAAQRQPLTEEQIEDIWNRYCDEMGEASINDAYDIARAIEAAHGIGEKK
jgi:hypothetical protein